MPSGDAADTSSAISAPLYATAPTHHRWHNFRETRRWFVNQRDEQHLPDHDRRRAADLGIALCAGRRLPELSAMLGDWLAGGQ